MIKRHEEMVYLVDSRIPEDELSEFITE